jgi:hypothetical protein
MSAIPERLSIKGIAPVPGYVQVVKDWPMPTNRSEVRTFLCKTGYYGRFMENYAEVAGPLTDILKQDGTDDRAPFDQTSTKNKVVSCAHSRLPQVQLGAPFHLGHGLESRESGRWSCTYGASKLTTAQSAYHSTKGEMAAAIIYIRKWKYYLHHRRFILRIDNAAMQWIRTLVEPVQGMVQRWLQTLANNEFDVVH